ncbi:hypothetical protein P9847_08420 [Paenibacillus chibensis]|uniref:Uncharacterized protein n=1 Tax=Paenibacillus chibensis TaxID=59846 RepID=A0ABU6PR38_9BACL|nr:hypothetical protein [Paenibacillus chibensis]
MGKYLTRKIIAAVLSAVVFCLFLAGVWMMTLSENGSDSGSSPYSFMGLFFIYLIYGTPFYLVFGTAVSFLVDTWRNQRIRRGRKLHPAIAALLYAVAGALLFILFMSYVTTGFSSAMMGVSYLYSGLYGAAAGWIYWAWDGVLVAAFRRGSANP